MKRIWLCLALVAGIFVLTIYSTHRVRSFADDLTVQLDTASEALLSEDLPAAHQAILQGASLCEEMRRGSVLYLRTEDFLELEASLRAAAQYLTEGAQEEAQGELGRAAFLAESVDWLTRRWL
ncbi:MAG TPA: DUF4363 family protein [Candidatus Faecalibacterium faecigallinarum]|uniref:DUF4363 family protein n=1 Tax=Candidatus Faecalibacterium faecigallinarum TaxID=2838577 RepID=A0A9D2P9J1_9FIRM|nr:DUF4363 family protein [Candidatus Faecalibacterium faecigallinarum]